MTQARWSSDLVERDELDFPNDPTEYRPSFQPYLKNCVQTSVIFLLILTIITM